MKCFICGKHLDKKFNAFIMLNVYDNERGGKLVQSLVVCSATPDEISAGIGSACAKELRKNLEYNGQYYVTPANV